MRSPVARTIDDLWKESPQVTCCTRGQTRRLIALPLTVVRAAVLLDESEGRSSLVASEIPAALSGRHSCTVVLAVAVGTRRPDHRGSTVSSGSTRGLDVYRVAADLVGQASSVVECYSLTAAVSAGVIVVESGITIVNACGDGASTHGERGQNGDEVEVHCD
jgi:hypothetical protein